jgi:hypothetical protein
MLLQSSEEAVYVLNIQILNWIQSALSTSSKAVNRLDTTAACVSRSICTAQFKTGLFVELFLSRRRLRVSSVHCRLYFVFRMTATYPVEFAFFPKTWIFPKDIADFQRHNQELKRKSMSKVYIVKPLVESTTSDRYVNSCYK